MAIEFSVYTLFMFLLYFCLERFEFFSNPPKTKIETFRKYVTAFIFVARAFISGAFQCVYVYTPEVSNLFSFNFILSSKYLRFIQQHSAQLA